MYIVFLDESGQPGGFDKENNKLVENASKYFTLAGFMIDADKILEIEKHMRDIKIKYGLDKQHEIKWHTTYSKLGLNFEQYKNMKLEIISVISRYKNSVIGIVMDKESCYKNKDYIKSPNDLYAVALHLLMERSCMETTKKKQKEDLIPTIMIADSRQSINSNKLDKELQISYLRAKNMGTHFVKFPNFCESIIFVDSDDFSGVQMADFCAGAIHKKYEREDNEFFNVLLPAIVSKKNNIYGPGIKFYK
ncbi:MAG: DUF3800 domain-containing protein [Bacilli bacterium]|nr:DUF3800 domain-containing protein [Bacilli bacterium]